LTATFWPLNAALITQTCNNFCESSEFSLALWELRIQMCNRKVKWAILIWAWACHVAASATLVFGLRLSYLTTASLWPWRNFGSDLPSSSSTKNPDVQQKIEIMGLRYKHWFELCLDINLEATKLVLRPRTLRAYAEPTYRIRYRALVSQH
jgi:hypothetical protein